MGKIELKKRNESEALQTFMGFKKRRGVMANCVCIEAREHLQAVE